MSAPRLRHRTYDPDVEKVVPKDAVVLAEWERELLIATAPGQVTKVVPVNSIVLNPDSGVVWGFLKDHEVDSPGAPRCFALAQEIRQQMPSPKPARIDEPGLWGVVEASVAVNPTVRRWVRYGTGWRDAFGGHLDWSDLIDPVLIRDGVVES